MVSYSPQPILTLLLLATISVANSEPPFENSIVSTDFDFITDDDPTTFVSLRLVERGTQEMPDKRHDGLFAKNTFVFEAQFGDDTVVEIWAHADFGTEEAASTYANMAAVRIGKLPRYLRAKLSHVVIHQGDEVAFGEELGHFFVLYSENMDIRVRNHDLEETIFHEAIHATLEKDYATSEAWLAAQKADPGFITRYAASLPLKEDLPESAIFAYTIIKHPGRLPEPVEATVKAIMPNRLQFFRELFGKLDAERGSEPEDTLASVNTAALQLVTVEGLGTVELIALLAHPNELIRTRAHLKLRRFLVEETEHPEFYDRLTLFHKHAPHACKQGHEAQTLHILGLFAAQEDISSILVKQCLRSNSAKVRATALEIAHFTDNRIDEELLAFAPDPETIESYRVALRNLGTAPALKRLAELE